MDLSQQTLGCPLQVQQGPAGRASLSHGWASWLCSDPQPAGGAKVRALPGEGRMGGALSILGLCPDSGLRKCRGNVHSSCPRGGAREEGPCPIPDGLPLETGRGLAGGGHLPPRTTHPASLPGWRQLLRSREVSSKPHPQGAPRETVGDSQVAGHQPSRHGVEATGQGWTLPPVPPARWSCGLRLGS